MTTNFDIEYCEDCGHELDRRGRCSYCRDQHRAETQIDNALMESYEATK